MKEKLATKFADEAKVTARNNFNKYLETGGSLSYN